MECLECKKTENLHRHHVIPRSLGGKATVFLCEECHSIVHQYKDKKKFVNVSNLIKKGLNRIRKEGVKLGAPEKIINIEEVFKLSQEGLSFLEISKKVGVSTATISRKLNKYEPYMAIKKEENLIKIKQLKEKIKSLK